MFRMGIQLSCQPRLLVCRFASFFVHFMNIRVHLSLKTFLLKRMWRYTMKGKHFYMVVFLQFFWCRGRNDFVTLYIVFPDSAWVDIVRFFYIKEFGQTFSNLTDWLGCKEKCCWHDWEIQAKAWANKGYTVLKLLFIKFAEFVVSNPLKSHFRLWNLMFITT